MKRHTGSIIAAGISLCLIILAAFQVLAVAPANEHFERTWSRTDKPVADGQVTRTWMWGPDAFTGILHEPYLESPGGMREVQYLDKSRMEITDPNGDPSSIWYVTNGLLVVELITGQMQVGHDMFEPGSPAAVNVAGDADDPDGPTYATFGGLLDEPATPPGTMLTSRVDRAGIVTDDPALAAHGLIAEHLDEVTQHTVAAPFWTFMNSSGTVWENGAFVEARLFESSVFATGRPIAEAYWANVKVANVYRDVLMQCFERRCLTYDPSNDSNWRTEAGNVGQHYYAWRYGQNSDDDGTATATATGTATATATSTTTTATVTATPPPVTGYQYVSQIDQWTRPNTRLDRPRGMAFNAQSNLYVADTFNHRIQKFTANGGPLAQWGSQGSGDGQFNHPSDIAIDSAGNIYVADTDNHRIQVFAPDGSFLRKWGGLGSGNGQLNSPWALAFDAAGDLYVADAFNHRVQVFSASGAYLRTWGSLGSGDGQFRFPYGIAIVNPSGNSFVYVLDTGNNRVQSFDVNGVYQGQWGSSGSGNGQFNGPTGITASMSGDVYVADTGNHRIQRFRASGNYASPAYLLQWGSEGSGDGQLRYPYGVEISPAEWIYVTDSFNNRVQWYGGNQGDLYDGWRGEQGRFMFLAGVAVDGNDNLYLANRDVGLAEKFDSAGAYLDSLPVDDAGGSERTAPIGVAVDGDGYIYVVDQSNHRVLKFSGSGDYVTQWGSEGTGVGQFKSPRGIALDVDNNVFVTEASNDRVQKFSSTGVYLGQWGNEGSGPGQFKDPLGIAVHGNRCYVADSKNDRIQVFDLDGAYLGQWGSSGPGPGEFGEPRDVAVDRDGYVYVADGGNHRIQKFTADGIYVTDWGSMGNGNGQFSTPYGIAVDASGDVYVVDLDNRRVQKFRPVN